MPPTSVFQDLGRELINVCRLHRTRANQFMTQLGVHSGQAMLLLILSGHNGMTHSEIAEKLEISPAAVTKVIKRMERAGYLQRESDPDDERVSRVYLLDKGRAMSTTVDGAFGELDRRLFDGFPDADLRSFQDLVARMRSNLEHWEP